MFPNDAIYCFRDISRNFSFHSCGLSSAYNLTSIKYKTQNKLKLISFFDDSMFNESGGVKHGLHIFLASNPSTVKAYLKDDKNVAVLLKELAFSTNGQ